MVNGTISSSLILSNNRSINGTFIYYRHLIQYIGPRRPPRGSFSTCANFCAISLTYFGNSNPKTNISVCNEFVFNTTFSLRISRSGVRISPGAPLNPLLSEISSSHESGPRVLFPCQQICGNTPFGSYRVMRLGKVLRMPNAFSHRTNHGLIEPLLET
jgi:hypothetical protein